MGVARAGLSPWFLPRCHFGYHSSDPPPNGCGPPPNGCGPPPNGFGSKPMVPFWGIGAPPILEPMLVGIGMLTGGYDLEFDPPPNGTVKKPGNLPRQKQPSSAHRIESSPRASAANCSPVTSTCLEIARDFQAQVGLPPIAKGPFGCAILEASVSLGWVFKGNQEEKLKPVQRVRVLIASRTPGNDSNPLSPPPSNFFSTPTTVFTGPWKESKRKVPLDVSEVA